MPEMITIFYNPRCSKCRQAVELLGEERVVIREYLKDAPSPEELAQVCSMLGVQPTAIIRTKEKRFSELGLSLDNERGREEWLQILSENPVLIERPILIKDGKAIIGRPPEKVLKILG